MASGTAPRALRADAARNRERILAAARRVFSEHGLEASVAEVARVAGVGKATVFRSFAAKEDLISAVALDRVRWVRARAVQALDEPVAWTAFVELLGDLAERHAADLTVAEALALATEDAELDRARAEATAALRALMDRAKAEGTMRTDAEPGDLRVLFLGVTRAMPEDQRHDPRAWTRWAQLFAGALRAP